MEAPEGNPGLLHVIRQDMLHGMLVVPIAHEYAMEAEGIAERQPVLTPVVAHHVVLRPTVVQEPGGRLLREVCVVELTGHHAMVHFADELPVWLRGQILYHRHVGKHAKWIF
jgi:hypothetical protein